MNRREAIGKAAGTIAFAAMGGSASLAAVGAPQAIVPKSMSVLWAETSEIEKHCLDYGCRRRFYRSMEDSNGAQFVRLGVDVPGTRGFTLNVQERFNYDGSVTVRVRRMKNDHVGFYDVRPGEPRCESVIEFRRFMTEALLHRFRKETKRDEGIDVLADLPRTRDPDDVMYDLSA